MNINHLGCGVVLFENVLQIENYPIFEYLNDLEKYTFREKFEENNGTIKNSGGYDHTGMMKYSPVRFLNVVYPEIKTEYFNMLEIFEKSIYNCVIQYCRHFPVAVDCVKWKTRGYFIKYSHGQMIGPHNDCALPYGGKDNIPLTHSPIGNTLTTGLFINNDFEGGEMLFRPFGISCKPSPGSILVYSSNYMGCHEVEPIKNGIRYAYLSWFKHGLIDGHPTGHAGEQGMLRDDAMWLSGFSENVGNHVQKFVPVGKLEVL